MKAARGTRFRTAPLTSVGHGMPAHDVLDMTAEVAVGVTTSVSDDDGIVSTRQVARLVVLLFLGAMSTAPVDATQGRHEMFRLDKEAELFAREMAAEAGYVLNWVDLWFNKTENRKRRTNREYQLVVDIGNMEFGKLITKPGSTKVQRLYETTLEGKTKHNTTLEVSEYKQVAKSSSLETFKGFESNSTCTIEGGIPGFVKISAGWGLEVILHKVKTEVDVTKEDVSLAVNITVPPKRRVTVTWLATTVETQLPWTVKVKVRGHFVADFKGAYNGGHQRVYSVADMAPHFDELTRTGEHEVTYTASGILRDVKATRLEVRVKEEKINRGKEGRN
ncbi:uncharacterized protein LOC144150251 [Haemaphysalis longicornis]